MSDKKRVLDGGPAYYVGVHRYSFRAGLAGQIVGVRIVAPPSTEGPERQEPRPCFVVKHENKDGTFVEDYCPIGDTTNYRIISAQDIFDHKIPEVTE